MKVLRATGLLGSVAPVLAFGAIALSSGSVAAAVIVTPPQTSPARPAPSAAACGDLARARLPDTAIVSVESIPAGAYRPPGSKVSFPDLPAFCRVVAVVKPAPDSSIGIEIWLPQAGWNGRYQQVGNHGWGGTIYWDEMAPQLRRGFATGGADDGHPTSASPFDVSWAFGHPAKIDDIAWRAVHETAKTAKLVVRDYYGARPVKSYFNGCSDGGREALREAQQFPTDFDGILSGGAGIYWTRAADAQLYVTANLKAAGLEGDRGALALSLSQAAAVRQCSSIPGGVVGGVIMDPRRCRWDPHALVCREGQEKTTCLTAPEADALARDIRGPVDAKGGQSIFGMPVGSEFNQLRFGYNRGLAPFGLSNYQLAYNDPSWNGSRYDPATDPAVLDRKLGVLNTDDPDLRKFKAAGGKLIEYQGWADAAAMPSATVDYYDRVIAKTGTGSAVRVQEFYRLFMMPGVGHCGTGPGPDNIGSEGYVPVSFDPDHDAVTALQAWVEHGRAPEKLVASRLESSGDARTVSVQRPVCSYPAQASWDGFGDVNKASSFTCRRPGS